MYWGHSVAARLPDCGGGLQKDSEGRNAGDINNSPYRAAPHRGVRPDVTGEIELAMRGRSKRIDRALKRDYQWVLNPLSRGFVSGPRRRRRSLARIRCQSELHIVLR